VEWGERKVLGRINIHNYYMTTERLGVHKVPHKDNELLSESECVGRDLLQIIFPSILATRDLRMQRGS